MHCPGAKQRYVKLTSAAAVNVMPLPGLHIKRHAAAGQRVRAFSSCNHHNPLVSSHRDVTH